MNLLINFLDSLESVGGIGGLIGIIVGSIGSILTAVAVFIKKINWKNKNEIIKSIHKEDVEQLGKVIKEQADIIKEAVKKKD